MTSNQSNLGNSNAIDLSGALQRLRGDRRLLLDLIGFFLDDCPSVAAKIHSASHAQNSADLALAAHSLKGLAANFDAQEVMDAADAIEQHARQDELSDAIRLIPALDGALHRLTADLCNYRSAQAS
jgi:HPt (histidine-containing phosphotransfer) domain-containing protein